MWGHNKIKILKSEVNFNIVRLNKIVLRITMSMLITALMQHC